MRKGVAVDIKTNEFVETSRLTDDELQAALADEVDGLFMVGVLAILGISFFIWWIFS